jgi:hypothetical protein
VHPASIEYFLMVIIGKMTPVLRKILATLSAFGFAVSILVYIESFSGATMDNTSQCVILLGFCVLALMIPIHILEYPSSKDWNFYWKGFARGMPGWIVPCNWLFFLIFIAHVIWLAVQSKLGVPTISDGQYVLSSHGNILKVITQAEYLTLKEAELRTLATFIISWYFMPMMYWWFPRGPKQTGLQPLS